MCPLSPNLHVYALIPSVTIFDKAFKEVIKLSEIIRMRLYGISFLRRGDTRALSLSLCKCTKERPCEHTARSQLPESREESSPQDPSMLAPSCQTWSLQNCEK